MRVHSNSRRVDPHARGGPPTDMTHRLALLVVLVLGVASLAWGQFRGADSSVEAHLARDDSFDGKFHSVDSNEASFKMAARLGFREAMSKAIGERNLEAFKAFVESAEPAES